MRIGIPKEVKQDEFRAGATPRTVHALIAQGHIVSVQKGLGERIGFPDSAYQQAGAILCSTAEEIYQCEMILKVKEPQKEEWPLLKKDQVLFCYLHLAAEPDLTDALLDKRVVAIAYETVTDRAGRLPLLIPMSEVAGRLSVQCGAYALQMVQGGCGTLLGGIPGVRPGQVVVLGGGIVGTEAIRIALGMGAHVTVLDRSLERLRELDLSYAPSLKTLFATPSSIEESVLQADLVIGAVLITGKKAPRLVTETMVKKMKKGSVIVDVAVDQGGCIETTRPTTHSNPTYVMHDVVHYGVTNMPSAAARTSTEGLTHATLPFVLEIGSKGYKKALLENKYLLEGLNISSGKVCHPAVAEATQKPYYPPQESL